MKLFAWALFLGVAACSNGSTPDRTPDGTSPPAAADAAIPDGSAPPDGPLGCGGCGANQVCAQGMCVAVPMQCPCPRGSYCDLATSSCKVGCLADDDCAAGTYCDTVARTCKTGCRTADECGPADVCEAHACTNHCGSCDDQDPCTVDSCQKDQCVHTPGNDGAACPDDGDPCSKDLCAAGQCTHPPGLPDDTSCSSDAKRIALCKQGVCTAPKETCDHTSGGDLLYYDGAVINRVTRGCGCASPSSFTAHFDPATVSPADSSWPCSRGCETLAGRDLCF
jgi:hypothetical protein